MTNVTQLPTPESSYHGPAYVGYVARAMRRFGARMGVERDRQLAKWGVQRHPQYDPATVALLTPLATMYRSECDRKHRAGVGTWNDILLEEVFEAVSETDPRLRREELVQVATVCASMAEQLDEELGDAE